MGDRPIVRPLPTQKGTTRKKNANICPCLERDWNPRSQYLSGPKTSRASHRMATEI